MRLRTEDIALVISFAALYVVLSLVSLFPIIGDAGKFMTLASVAAPLIGMLLGPYVGAGAVAIGGFVGWSITQTGTFHFLSFVPGASTAFCSGLLSEGKQVKALVLYMIIFMSLAFYPVVGPMWLYPHFLWFHVVGLVVLISPLTQFAFNSIDNGAKAAKLAFGIGVISLVSTLLGQMTGSLMFVATRYPTFFSQIEYWRTGQWQILTFVYPVERSIMTVLATLLGAPLIRTIRAPKFGISGE